MFFASSFVQGEFKDEFVTSGGVPLVQVIDRSTLCIRTSLISSVILMFSNQ